MFVWLCHVTLMAVVVVWFSPAFVCMSVCLSVYPHDISKTAAARITTPDMEMFYHESWQPIYFGIKWSKVKVTRHAKTVPVWVFALLWVLASSLAVVSRRQCDPVGVCQTRHLHVVLACSSVCFRHCLRSTQTASCRRSNHAGIVNC